MILANGTRLRDRYLIDALVGQGGMGAVYRATDLHLGHTVAIKENLFPHDDSEDASEGSDPSSQSTGSRRSQFEREAQMLARLKHSGLPKVTDHFVIPDQGQYLVMEFVEGEDLSTRLKRNGPMGERDALNIANRVCDILTYLHSQKPPIIHRDLKPANIRLTPEGDVVVVDFGVAKLFTSEATVTAARAVTPGFSPLEQYGGSQSTDERSDIYALGATIHQLVVGKRPPEAPMRVTASAAAGQAWLEMPTVTPALATVLRKAMEMRPEDRYQKIGELSAALRAVPILEDTGDVTRAATVIMPPAGQVTAPMGNATPGAPTLPAGGPPTFAVPTAPVAPGMPGGPGVGGNAPTTPVTMGPGTVAPTVVASLPPLQTPAGPPPPVVPPQAAAPAAPAGPPRMTAYEGTIPVAGGGAYAAPPAEKKGNKTPLFIGVGVLVLLLLGGGGYLAMNMGKSGGGSTVASNTPTPVEHKDPPAGDVPGSQDRPAAPEISQQIPAQTTPTGSTPTNTTPTNTTPANTGSGRPTDRPATTPPQSNVPPSTPPQSNSPAQPMLTPPSVKTPAVNPPAATPPSSQNNGGAVPLTDNPGQAPGMHGTTTTTGAPAVTPPAVTPPASTPPASSTQPPTTPGGGNQPVVPPPVSLTPPKSLGDTLFVDSTGRPGTYSTVSDAVHAANDALDGRVRTLLIKPGTYPRATILFMGRSAKLIGDGPPGSVIVEASGVGLSLEGAGILVRNITVRAGTKVAVNVQGEARIEGCEFTSASGPAGVQVQGSANVTLTNCKIKGSGERGLLVVGGRARLENCELSGNKVGVNVSGSGNVVMSGGTITNNVRSGVRVAKGGSITLSDVAITGNMLDGVQAEGGSVTLKNCRINQNRQFGVSCLGAGSSINIDGGDLTLNLRGAVEDSCGAVTKTGGVREK